MKTEEESGGASSDQPNTGKMAGNSSRRPLIVKLLVKMRKTLNAAWRQGTLEKLCLAMSTMSVIVGVIEMVQQVHHVVGGNVLEYLFVHAILVYIAILAALLITVRKIGYLNHASHVSSQSHERQIAVLSNQSRQRREAVCRDLHSTSHITRDYISFLLTNAEFDEVILQKLSVGVLNTYCDKLSQMISELHDKRLEFRVSIKAVGPGRKVYTLARDSHTRKHMDHSIDKSGESLYENSDFNFFMNQREVVWACDDLKAAAETGNYHNSHMNWIATYNATMIVPIRKTFDYNENKGFELAGFLCADCMRHNGVPHVFFTAAHKVDPALRDLLLAYADVAFSIIKKGRVCPKGESPTSCVFDETNFPFVAKLNHVFVEGMAIDPSGSSYGRST